MQTALNIVQIIVAIILVIVVLLQVRGQGANLFGSSEGSYRTRRGLEKTLFQFTIVLIVIFIGLSLTAVRIYK